MRIEDFNIKDAGEVFLDPQSYRPKRKIIVELELGWEAQYDGHARSAEQETECFYQSARPLLDHIKQAVYLEQKGKVDVMLCFHCGGIVDPDDAEMEDGQVCHVECPQTEEDHGKKIHKRYRNVDRHCWQ
jgi:hypothetical protein